MAKQLYVVSDLHFGGDGQLQICDFTEEFIRFLRQLARAEAETELIVAGDTFGFWELTTLEGAAQLDEIVRHHQTIFEQFKKTGERIQITMMVGNHDYDLACDPIYVQKLAAYNIRLDTNLSVVRSLGARTIWIEHGQQVDPFNRAADYGNPFALPAGFFITQNFVSAASLYSTFGANDWLKDIRSVDVRSLPDWLLSNYFYNEMNLVLRWLLLPFLLLVTITAAALAAQLLKAVGIFDANILLDNPLIRRLGLIGDAVRWILLASMFVWFFVFAVSLPLYVIYRDVRRTLVRFRVFPTYKSAANNEANNFYLARAREVFAARPDVCAFVFGHTHDAFLLEEPGGRAIINTGTWLKILRRVPVRFGLLPAVYCPTFRLNYFRIAAENDCVMIDYIEIPKEPFEKLSLLQRALIFGRKPAAGKFIRARTVLASAANQKI